MSKKKKITKGLAVFLCICTILLGVAGGFAAALFIPQLGERLAPIGESDTFVSGELKITFLELGNKYTGDCTLIQVGDVEVLIDGGSRVGSVDAISSYLNSQMTDNKLDYAVITHAHQDHYAAFTKRDGSLFDLYECGTIIDFALTNQTDGTMYQNYLAERADEIAAGATHLTAADCINQNKSLYDLGNGVTMEVLDSYFYFNTTSDENDYSVCILIRQGDNAFLFTGDLEAEGEEKLVERNTLPRVKVYKAGHHGSKTSSSTALLSVIQPEICCV